jgi:16S rRNA (cytosine1402-N4)-methyltransferase
MTSTGLRICSRSRLVSGLVSGPGARRLLASATDPPSGPEPRKYHTPVMLEECMQYLAPSPGRLIIDGTLGGGGHTAAMLERGGDVIGIDQDDDAIAESTSRLQQYISTNNLEIRKRNFRGLEDIISTSTSFAGRSVDGILLDLGMSSHQINVGDRGFSFQNDGALDMRMDRGVAGRETALDIVNTWSGEDLANLFYQFGDETNSKKIAREIVASRPLQTTQQLNTVIRAVTPAVIAHKSLSKCFQALRIYINDELGALDSVLMAAMKTLRPGGVLCVLSYHSLEDRRVKVAFQNKYPETIMFNGDTASSIKVDEYIEMHQTLLWEPVKKKPMLPTKIEIKENSRSRSAKLRVAVKREKV